MRRSKMMDPRPEPNNRTLNGAQFYLPHLLPQFPYALGHAQQTVRIRRDDRFYLKAADVFVIIYLLDQF